MRVFPKSFDEKLPNSPVILSWTPARSNKIIIIWSAYTHRLLKTWLSLLCQNCLGILHICCAGLKTLNYLTSCVEWLRWVCVLIFLNTAFVIFQYCERRVTRRDSFVDKFTIARNQVGLVFCEAHIIATCIIILWYKIYYLLHIYKFQPVSIWRCICFSKTSLVCQCHVHCNSFEEPLLLTQNICNPIMDAWSYTQ